MAGAFMTGSVYGDVLQGCFPYLISLVSPNHRAHNRRESPRIITSQQPIYRQSVGARIVDRCSNAYGCPKTHLAEMVKRADDHYHPLHTFETGRVSILRH